MDGQRKIDLDEVRELLQGKSREEILSYIKKLIPTDKVSRSSIKSEHGKPLSYTTVVKAYRCLGCGSNFVKKYALSRNEDVIYIDPAGVAHNVKVSGKLGEVVVPCVISKCSNCACMARIWTREELEIRFLALLKSSTFKEVAVYNLVIKEVKRVEDFISSHETKRGEEALSEVRCSGGEDCSPCCVCKQTTLDFSIPKADNCAASV